MKTTRRKFLQGVAALCLGVATALPAPAKPRVVGRAPELATPYYFSEYPEVMGRRSGKSEATRFSVLGEVVQGKHITYFCRDLDIEAIRLAHMAGRYLGLKMLGGVRRGGGEKLNPHFISLEMSCPQTGGNVTLIQMRK